MKKGLSLLILLLVCAHYLSGQNYANIVNYNFNDTPVHGVKIKTNLPFAHGVTMPTVKIEGYNWRSTLSLSLVWYVYENLFMATSASSSGGTTPDIWLSNENGKVVIFLDQKIYYQRFTVSAFAQGKEEKPEYFQGWTVVDAALSGTQQKQVPYKNVFAGNVGIGTENPQVKLDVRGTISAEEVKVQILSGADHVFNHDYELKPLSEVEAFVKENKHLPEIPSEKQMLENGISLNEFQIKLLQKIEELTLYVIDLKKENQEQHQRILELEKTNK